MLSAVAFGLKVLSFAVAAATLSPAQIDQMLGNAEKQFSSYVFPDVAAKTIAMLKAGTPRYETISDPEAFQKAVNADLFRATHDKHVSLWYPFDAQESDDDNSPSAQAQRHSDALVTNNGFATVRRLAGNVGYIDLRYFSEDESVKDTVKATMSFLANTDALIIDLRRNGGGNPIAARALEGYLFAQRQQVTSIEFRDAGTGRLSETKQFTDTAQGPLYLNKSVYVLTSSHTFSCAEQFSYDMRNLHRITLIGDTTGGGANPGDVHYIGAQFAIFVPNGYAHSPVTNTNWESVGVTPDISVSANEALTRAYDLALHQVQAHATNKGLLAQIADVLKDEQKFLALAP